MTASKRALSAAPSGTTIHTTIASPVGELLLWGDGHALRGISMQDGPRPIAPGPHWEPSPAPFEAVEAQLAQYFDGQRTTFDLPLVLEGTPFQQLEWRALLEIPYGATESYSALARRIGRPNAPRAVGLANGSNPISIIVPCHRLIGTNGSLTGYGGGLERKRFLLELEARVLAGMALREPAAT